MAGTSSSRSTPAVSTCGSRRRPVCRSATRCATCSPASSEVRDGRSAMRSSLPDRDTVHRALVLLEAVSSSAAEPAEATIRLDALRDQVGDVTYRLLWQRESFDGSLLYNLLLRMP